jgi:PTH1 family peptidyl-tRNA hydrolase
MRLIVGLGNPGPKYHGTRHNIGFRCVDLMSKMWSIPITERRSKAVLGRGVYAGQEVVLAKPRTFMNNSGHGVSYLLTRFAADIDHLLVIYDDMELPLGRLRIRSSGSDGGHRGVESIISNLRTQTFPRMRLGIGAPPEGQDSVDFVLGAFSKEESVVVDRAVETVVQAVECWLEEDIDAAMNQFN